MRGGTRYKARPDDHEARTTLVGRREGKATGGSGEGRRHDGEIGRGTRTITKEGKGEVELNGERKWERG